MKSNDELQKNVRDAIRWEPSLSGAEIGVTANAGGVITLTGTVSNFNKRKEAEDVAKNVAGVKAVVEKIEIYVTSDTALTDVEIATRIVNDFKWSWQIPNGAIQIKVEKGWITMEGNLKWNYQREAAKKIVTNLPGVRGLTNDLKIVSQQADRVEKKEVEKAFSRSWSTKNQPIEVDVISNKIVLTGNVHSIFQKEEANKIAWNAPGVWQVEDKLTIA
jgi:osmotically-inducible protein OsmY